MCYYEKNAEKLIAVFLLVTILCGSFAQGVSADGFYTHNRHRFIQGIANVECVNSINEYEYNTLWRAVNGAILDWNWHLGLLQTWYGVDWNVSRVYEGNYDGMHPEVEFYAMDFEEFQDTYDDYNQFYNGIPCARTRWYRYSNSTSRNHISLNAEDGLALENWTSTEIVFFYDMLNQCGYLNDYNVLKTIANHEIGHTLGLAHDDHDTGVIMYPYYEEMTASVPTRRDLETVYYIYSN